MEERSDLSCPICGKPGKIAFHKHKQDYAVCGSCGFGWCHTIYQMTDDEFAELNDRFHEHWQSNPSKLLISYRSQRANTLIERVRSGVLPKSGWLDYGCGPGEMMRLLQEGGIEIKGYEPFLEHQEDLEYDDEPEKYDVVLATALLEHLRGIEDIERVCDCVADGGCLIFHTWTGHRVPYAHDWHYIQPQVHCSFYTRRALKILFEKFGFKSSTWWPKTGGLYIWFKDERGSTLGI